MIMMAESMKDYCDKAIEQAMNNIKTVAQGRPESVADSMISYVESLKRALLEKQNYEDQLRMLKSLKKEDER